jgi:aspartyl-tRNA synthetase
VGAFLDRSDSEHSCILSLLHFMTQQSIFRIQSGVCQFFREFLTGRDFIEIHSPKLLGGASEGGANVFTLDYFGTPACLAQVSASYLPSCVHC